MVDERIEQMIRQRQLERVSPNPGHAANVLETASRHLQNARLLAQTDDHAMAFTAAYDATRKALAGVLATEGLRVRPVGGAHRNTGIAAALFVDDDALGEFEWMRQVRNATEYPDEGRPTATRQDVKDSIEAASDIVAACRTYLSTR